MLAPRVPRGVGLTCSHEAALDLTQDAFLRLFEARARIDSARRFFPLLYQVLRRPCFTWLRDSRGRARLLEGAASFVARPPALGEDPARTAATRDEHRRCVAAIAALPPREREVLVLKDMEGLRYREIAETVGIPIGTVMSRLYAARRRVALALGE